MGCCQIKLTFEECTTIITQIEACLNSQPLVPLPSDDDGIEALTLGHFVIGRLIEALSDPSFPYQLLSLPSYWHLCQALTHHFWRGWSLEYINSLKHYYTTWHPASMNLAVDDIVLLREDNTIPMKWPLAKVVEVYEGKDGLVRFISVTSSGTYKHPITKMALLLPHEN